MLLADFLQPVRAAPPGGGDGVFGADFTAVRAVWLFNNHAHAVAVGQNQVHAVDAEENLNAVLLQVGLDSAVDLLRLFGAHVADGTVHQAQAGSDGVPADALDALILHQAFHRGVRAEFQVDAIGIINQLLGLVLTNQLGQLAAHLVGKGELAVRKRTGARETCGDMAIRPAVDAAAGRALGAAAAADRLAFFNDEDFLFGALADQLQGGKNAGGAGADDDQVIVHGVSPSLMVCHPSSYGHRPCLSNNQKTAFPQIVICVQFGG